MKTANSNMIELDLTTPEKMDRFEERFERTRRLQANQLMDFGSFVKEFQKTENGK